MQWRGVRRLSVRLSVCKLLRKSLLLEDKWPDRHQTCTRWTPGQRTFRVCLRSRSRSKVTWYGHFYAGTKIASSPRQMARSPPLHTMVTRWTCIQSVLKVKVKVKVTWYAHFLGFLEWATPSLTVWLVFFQRASIASCASARIATSEMSVCPSVYLSDIHTVMVLYQMKKLASCFLQRRRALRRKFLQIPGLSRNSKVNALARGVTPSEGVNWDFKVKVNWRSTKVVATF